MQQVSLCLLKTGSHLQHFDFKSEDFFDEVSVMNRLPVSRTNSMYQVASFGRGSAYHKDLEQLTFDWEREIIFHCKSTIS